MALDTERNPPTPGAWSVLAGKLASTRHGMACRTQPVVNVVSSGWRSMRERLADDRVVERALGPLPRWVTRIGNWLARTWMFRLVTSTLARRIFVANLLGLLVLLVGILWLSQHQSWLITAKRESLRVQSEIIAAAIAASASADHTGLTIDPDGLPEVEGARLPFRDDGFAAFELTLPPEKIGRVVRRLIQPHHNTRARIYDRDGHLVVDSLPLGSKPSASKGDTAPSSERIRVKTLWTRLTAIFDGADINVYKEIGNANGNSYPEVRQALKGHSLPAMLLITDDNKQIVSLAVPIQRRNSTLGAVLLSTRPGEIDEVLTTERWIIYSLAAMALLATLMASMMLDRTIAAPVRRLSAAAEHVSQSINARADLPNFEGRRDEVGQMADAFKRMTAALYKRIEASEKFAADVAHELKNPLAAARSMAETLSYARTPEDRDELVIQIQGELKRLNRLITDVSNASRLDAELARQKNVPVDIGQTLTNLVSVFRDLHSESGIKINLALEDRTGSPLVVNGHEGRLGQVATNLLDNAISFAKPGQAVTVRAHHVGTEIEIIVEDEGPGMPDDKLDAIFERFYSDRPESDRTRGKNSGLGLSISREIILAHGGRIWAENRRSAGSILDATGKPKIEGARFVVRLPAGQGGIVMGQTVGRRIQ